jgi:hypothetical protein
LDAMFLDVNALLLKYIDYHADTFDFEFN